MICGFRVLWVNARKGHNWILSWSVFIFLKSSLISIVARLLYTTPGTTLRVPYTHPPCQLLLLICFSSYVSCCFVCAFLDRFLLSNPNWPGSCFVDQAHLKLQQSLQPLPHLIVGKDPTPDLPLMTAILNLSVVFIFISLTACELKDLFICLLPIYVRFFFFFFFF